MVQTLRFGSARVKNTFSEPKAISAVLDKLGTTSDKGLN